MTNNLIENFEDLNHMINLNKLNSLILINNPITYKYNYKLNI